MASFVDTANTEHTEHTKAAEPPRAVTVRFECLCDVTGSMGSAVIVFRRSSPDSDTWTRTNEQYDPTNVAQQVDIRNGLLEIHHAHLDGLKDLIDKQLQINGDTKISVWKFGGGPDDYSCVLEDATNMEEVNWSVTQKKLEPRYNRTALLHAMHQFLTHAVTVRKLVAKEVVLQLAVATDGIENVQPHDAELTKKVQELVKKVEDMPNVNLTFIAAGREEVMQVAVHQLGINSDAVLFCNSQNPTAVTSAFRALSDQLENPHTPVAFTQLQRGTSAAGGYANYQPVAPPVAPPRPGLIRSQTMSGGGGRGISSGC